MRLKKIAGRHYTHPTLQRLEGWVSRTFTPSDWLIAGFFLIVAAGGAFAVFIEASFAVATEVPVHGGTYVEGVIGVPRFINPVLATSDADRDVTLLVFGGLMKTGPDGGVYPHLADSYEMSEDGVSYAFHLKDDIFFHDGTPITAEDVVFTVGLAKNPDIKSPRRANWEGVEAVAEGPKTVRFTLRAPYALFVENTTLGILPKHLWKDVPVEEFSFSDLNTDPVGSGMYRLKSVKKQPSGVRTEYTLSAWGENGIRPYIQTLVFRFYSNREALERALASGEIDGAHSVLPVQPGETRVEEAVFARVFAIFFNQNQAEVFADTAVRRALDRAVDKKHIIDTVISGYGSPLSGPLPPQSVIANEPASASEGEERLSAARAILEGAGWKQGEDGIFTKTSGKESKRLAFTLRTSSAPELKRSAELVSEMWRSLGADVTLEFYEQNDLNTEVLRPRKYDALLFGLVVGRELDLFAFWHSSQRNDPGLNIALYASITADALLEEARSEPSESLRREKAELAAEEIASETAAVFLYAPHFTYVHEPRLRGVELSTVSAPSDRFNGIEHWYVSTETVWPVFTK